MKGSGGQAVAAEKIGMAGPKADGLTCSRDALSRSRQAFAGLFAATATLTGAAMTAKTITRAVAGPDSPTSRSATVRTVCTSCSVGCGLVARVRNGVWVRQEGAPGHPVSRGALCRKAAGIDMVGSPRRLKNPMKKKGGRWIDIPWPEAIGEIGERLLAIREKYGPDSLQFNGSAKVSTEMAYLQRKFAAFWGTNNIDHQARFCHAGTAAGGANIWGHGVMTNSLNDMRHAASFLFIGSNPPEAHPVAMQHILTARARNGAPVVVVDPERSQLAAGANDHLRIRPGTDEALVMGLIHVTLDLDLADERFRRTRPAALQEIAAAAAPFTPAKVAIETGIPAAVIIRIARLLAAHRPTSLIWCKGGTRHSLGSSITRSFHLLQLISGNMGRSGGGMNFLRGHDNVQGATDMGVLSDSLPAYTGLSEESWRHWCRVWDVDFSWMTARFRDRARMTGKGFFARWHDGDLPEETTHPYTPIKALLQWGCGASGSMRDHRVLKACNMLDLLVVVDPFPVSGAVDCPTGDVYLLPGTSQYETAGSVTSTSRQSQWRERVVPPVYDSRDDYRIMELLVERLGFAEEFYRNIKQVPEDISRELGCGATAMGYNGQTPERIKQHMENWHTFDIETLQAMGGPCAGEYYGLPWPCRSADHPGSPILDDPCEAAHAEVTGEAVAEYPELPEPLPADEWRVLARQAKTADSRSLQ